MTLSLRTNCAALFCTLNLIICISGAALAQQPPPNQKIDLGQWEYVAHCATCHGVTGKGDGPMSSLLKKPIANLTKLSSRNGGVFPFARVYNIIDGREEVQEHGPRDMPIWGRDYKNGAYVVPNSDPETFARAKILALTEYIYRLQMK